MPAPGTKEWRDRVNDVTVAEIENNPSDIYYLSFARRKRGA